MAASMSPSRNSALAGLLAKLSFTGGRVPLAPV